MGVLVPVHCLDLLLIHLRQASVEMGTVVLVSLDMIFKEINLGKSFTKNVWNDPDLMNLYIN